MSGPKVFSEVFWRTPKEELPDDDQAVLLHLEDGEIWTGFRDGKAWRYVSADRIDVSVLHWSPFPEPPED
jgi:hypothetical protein